MATFTRIADQPYLDGQISLLQRKTSRTECAAFRATSAKGRCSPIVYSEKDARRWIDECQVGGNPTGFLNELQNRRFRR